MYVPSIYRADDPRWVSSVIERYPLATLVTSADNAPLATHLAVIHDPDPQPGAGTVLLGHMNRSNPHWAALADGMQARLIFCGPHSYITPVTYLKTPTAPTWDFVAVHLLGTMTLLPRPDEVLHVVRKTAEALERRFGAGWDCEPSINYFRQIGPGVGAWRLSVSSTEAMFKLSQEQPPAVRRRVIEHLAVGSSGIGRDLADFMAEFELGGVAR